MTSHESKILGEPRVFGSRGAQSNREPEDLIVGGVKLAPLGSKGEVSERPASDIEINTIKKEPETFGSRNSGSHSIPDELVIVGEPQEKTQFLDGIESLVEKNDVDVLAKMVVSGELDSKLLVNFFTKCIENLRDKSSVFIKAADVLVELGILKYSLAEKFPIDENRERAGSSQTDLAKPFYLLRKTFEMMRSEPVEAVRDAMVRGELHPSIVRELFEAYKTPGFENKFSNDETLKQKFVEIKPFVDVYEEMYKAEALINEADGMVEKVAAAIEGGSVPQGAFRLLLKSYQEGSRPDPFHNQGLITNAFAML